MHLQYLIKPLIVGFSLVTVISSRSFQHRKQRSLDTGPSRVDGKYVFPEPKIENVYEAWKPIDYGHPLVDVTIHYAPPELERVRLDGSGPVPSRPTGNSKHHLVFEAAREVAERHTDERLQAEVYNSPRFDKGLSLLSRDTIVAIPSQRRNSFDPLRPAPGVSRHGKQDIGRGGLRRRKRPEKLKSGIYYVDDPHATFRDEHERAQERISDSEYEYFYEEDPVDLQTSSSLHQGVKYVPVSQITTPPTLASSTSSSYSDIVNKDFYDRLQTSTTRPRLSKTARRVNDISIIEEESQAFPLGTPYYYYSAHSHPAAGADNVVQPAAFANNQNHGQDSWLPTNTQPGSYNGYDREMEFEYRNRDEVIYSVKDSGELVLPSPDQTILRRSDPVEQELVRRDDPVQEYNLVYAVDNRSTRPVNVTETRRDSNDSNDSDPSIGQPQDITTHTINAASQSSGGLSRSDKLSSEFVYMLCMREVPRYLQSHLCKTPRPGSQARISRFSDTDQDHHQDQGVSVRLPPKPQFQFVQDNQYVSSTESVFQERTLAAVSDDNIIDDPFSAPFPYVTSSSSGPAPVIYTAAQSKVAVYKPSKTTTTTTTTTTAAPTTTLATTTTVRPYQYQIPTSETAAPAPPRPAVPPAPAGGQRKRPLLYTKRRQGGAQVSRPFEYLSRLSQFLSNKIKSRPGQYNNSRPSRGPPPQLQTRRIQHSPSES